MEGLRRGCRRTRRAVRLAAVLGGVAVFGSPAAAPAGPGALVFEEVSAVSGGPIDLGSPTSTVEKTSAAWVDVDGDGWDDLIALTGVDQACVYRLNRSDDAGGRTLVPAPPGNGLDSGAVFENDGASITAGDVDGDGDEDVFIGCGWNPAIPSGENALLLNDGTGVFTDVAAAVGLTDRNNTTAACALFDMDLDGDLDLVTANTDFEGTEKYGDGQIHLFRNTLRETGELGFVDEARARRVIERGKAVWQVTALDYDLDGDMDLLVPHDVGGLTQLLANNGNGFFTDVTAKSGAGAGTLEDSTTFGDDSLHAMGVAVADIENDGDLDLYITDIGYNPLYVNNGDGTFRELAGTNGCSEGTVSWGALFQDFDLDGFVDLHVAAGDFWGRHRPTVRPYLYHNRGDGTFDDVFAASGMRHDPPLHREVGTAASDYDGDGRVDIVVTRGHRFEGASPYLYRNRTETGGRRWVSLLLRSTGEGTNRSAVGAIVRAVPRDAGGGPIPGLTQLRHVTASDSRGARSSLWQTVGLGPDAATVDVEVIWPRAGTLASRTEVFVGLRPDERHVLTETRSAWRLEPTDGMELAGGASMSFPAKGGGGDPALVTCSVLDGPAWVRIGGFDGGNWSIEVDAPVVQEPDRHVVELLASAEGSESRQTLTVDVVPAPHIASVNFRRRHRQRIRLVGANFPRGAAVVLIDGIASPRVVVRRRLEEPDGDGSRIVATIPRDLRPGFRGVSHVVEVIDERTGRASAPFVFEPGR